MKALRVIVAKVGLDGHDRGAKVIAYGLRDAGMEVIYSGLRRTPEELAEIALQEDADAIGLSILSGAVVPLSRRVLAALTERGLDDVLVVVGGIIPPAVAEELRALGIDGAFAPGSTISEISDFLRREVPARRRRHEGTGPTAESNKEGNPHA